MLSTKIIGLCITALAIVQVHAVDNVDPGVRVQIPERLLLPVGDQNLAREGGFQLVPSYPPQDEWPTDLPAAQPGPVGAGEGGASSSRQPDEPEVSSQSARVPSNPQLPLGRKWFSMQSYPLDMHELQKFYHDDNFEPVNFESLYKNTRFQTSGMIYRPYPPVLLAIQGSIWPVLQRHNLRPNDVSPNYNLKHGEYLWPPFQPGPDGLPSLDLRPNLEHDLRQRITARVTAHSQVTPALYHMGVNVDGNTRHILMLTGRSKDFFDEKVHLPQSQIWLFYESAKVNREKTSKFAFLGASLLPIGAKEKLVENGVARAVSSAHVALPH
ncbi:uncharacterized protein UBRO_03684 [Ustilago bromivora]|uniref:Effector family protein Eff1 n=1 Tax=Ustilago bromivora TaxID=307758 RepID=A0A1K0H663_9BASI|nr:uncharacterized protein UBRO_03684 [Ustilago bromivora]